MPRRSRSKPAPPPRCSDFDLYHPSLESSPSVQRFLASVPPKQQQQCLRAALVYGIRHFLTIQSANSTVLNYQSMYEALSPPDASFTVQPVRRPVQPGRTLAAFPFVDESRFEPVRKDQVDGLDQDQDGVANLYDVGPPEDNTAARAISPPSPPPTTGSANAAPPNAVFASYPNWWPLENAVTPKTMKQEQAQAQAQAQETLQDQAQRQTRAAVATATSLAADTAKMIQQETKQQETKQEHNIALQSTFDPNRHPPTRTEIPWNSNDRPPLWEPKHRVQLEQTVIDETLLVDNVSNVHRNKQYKPFKARKIPRFKKKQTAGNVLKYNRVPSKIGAEVQQYRKAARRAKIRANEATDKVMESYAERLHGNRKGTNIEAATLASAIVDSGIMADLLATVPGPSVEIFPPPARKEDARRPTYESIMKEIELEAALECAASPIRTGTLEQASDFERRNYSSWLGDFGPPHTQTRL